MNFDSRAAVILVGGQSQRMGRPKFLLPFAGQPLLARVLQTVASCVEQRIVVAAPEQTLPPMPADVIIARDGCGGRGPLEGLRAGLASAAETCQWFFVTSCDAPLLREAFIERLFEFAEPTDDVVIPRDEHHHHPLCALYHRRVLPHLEELLAADRLRPFFLLERVAARTISVDQFRDVDPELHSLFNMNTPADYERALELLQDSV